MKIKEIKTNGIGTVEGIVIALEEKANKNNSSFINMTISDGETQIVAKVWNADLETFKFKTGQAVLVELKMEEIKGPKSYVALQFTESPAYPPVFICGAPEKSHLMKNFVNKPLEGAACMRQRSKRFLMTTKTI